MSWKYHYELMIYFSLSKIYTFPRSNDNLGAMSTHGI